jgi:cysteinyl-tRNA synthetase
VEAAVPDARASQACSRLTEDFAARLAEDLNLSAALAAVFAFVREVNVAIQEGGIGAGDKQRVLAALADVDRVLGVLDPAERLSDGAPDAGDAEIDRLVAERTAARKNRDFATSDRIRDQLLARGVLLEDTPQGTRWKRQ